MVICWVLAGVKLLLLVRVSVAELKGKSQPDFNLQKVKRPGTHLKVILLAISVVVPAETNEVLVAVKGTVAFRAVVAVLAPETDMVLVPLPPAIENCPL